MTVTDITKSTKERMLDAATILLLDKGVEASSVDDILKASHTGKSQFYHYFSSKAGMVMAVLTHILMLLGKGQWAGQALPAIDSWADLEGFLIAVSGAEGRDNPLALLTLTMARGERAAQPLLPALYDALRAPLHAFLQREQEAGRFAAGVSIDDLTDLALTAMIGASIKSSIHPANADAPIRAKAARHLFMYLKAYARA